MSTATPGEVLSFRSRRGTKREYETVMILRPETNKDGILDLIYRMQAVFKNTRAHLLKIDNWGTRTLAFPIKRCQKGIYMYWRFLGGSDVVAEFERNLRNLDVVIRYHTVKVDDDVDPNARPSEVTEEIINVVAEPLPEPEEEPMPEPSDDDAMRDDEYFPEELQGGGLGGTGDED